MCCCDWGFDHFCSHCSQHTSCCRCDCGRTLIIARLTLGDAVLATWRSFFCCSRISGLNFAKKSWRSKTAFLRFAIFASWSGSRCTQRFSFHVDILSSCFVASCSSYLSKNSMCYILWFTCKHFWIWVNCCLTTFEPRRTDANPHLFACLSWEEAPSTTSSLQCSVWIVKLLHLLPHENIAPTLYWKTLDIYHFLYLRDIASISKYLLRLDVHGTRLTDESSVQSIWRLILLCSTKHRNFPVKWYLSM